MKIGGGSARVAYPLFQTEDGGSIPTSPLQLSMFEQPHIDVRDKPVKSFRVKEIEYGACKPFCIRWHYSKSCPVGQAYFGLYSGLYLIGIACFGPPAMKNQKDCYSCDIELRRLCCIDDTPKNTESFFISKTLIMLRKFGVKRVLSLADPNHGHSGGIYKATNFTFLGEEQGGGSRDIFIDGEKVHSRTAFARYGASGQKKLSELLPKSKVVVKDKKRKLIYVYNL